MKTPSTGFSGGTRKQKMGRKKTKKIRGIGEKKNEKDSLYPHKGTRLGANFIVFPWGRGGGYNTRTQTTQETLKGKKGGSVNEGCLGRLEQSQQGGEMCTRAHQKRRKLETKKIGNKKQNRGCYFFCSNEETGGTFCAARTSIPQSQTAETRK